MNSNPANENKLQTALTHVEISFLEQKKSWAVMYVLVYIFALLFGYAMYFSMAIETDFKVILSLLLTIIFSIPITKETKKIGRINRDLRGNYKTVFTRQIEDYKQNIHTDKQGNITGGDYFLFFCGEKYEVKAKDFFKFGRGDLVKVSAAPNSKYVFSVEKIAAAPRSKSPDTLFQFISPLY